MSILKLPQVEAATGLKRSSIYAMIARSEFPKQIKLSKRSSGWDEAEINNWLETKKQARSAAGWSPDGIAALDAAAREL